MKEDQIYITDKIDNINSFKNNIVISDNINFLNNTEVRKKYFNKIKVIYIDPPYNTRTTKTYSDNLCSEKWEDFIKDRIISSYDFLKDDGVLFVSIDDNEIISLRKILDEIFGIKNFVGNFITNQSKRSNSKLINTTHEYILCYAKDIKKIKEFKNKRINMPEFSFTINTLIDKTNKNFNDLGKINAEKILRKEIKELANKPRMKWILNYSNISDSGKIYFAKDLSTPGIPRNVNIESINLKLDKLKTRGWSSDAKFIKLHNEKKLCYKNNRPYEIHYIEDSYDSAPSILDFYSRNGTNDIKKLGIDKLFDTPKPVELIKYLINLVAENDDIILDYFAGSGTTAQAVLEINKQENKNLKFTLVQINSIINSNTVSYTKAIEFGLEPKLDVIMLHRIKLFMQKEKIYQKINLFKG